MAKSVKLTDLEKQARCLHKAFLSLPEAKQAEITAFLSSVETKLTKAIVAGFTAYDSAVLSEKQEAELQKLQSELDKLAKPFDTKRKAAQSKLAKTMQAIDWTDPVAALSVSTTAQATYASTAEKLDTEQAEKQAETQKQIDQLVNVKAVERRKAFLDVFDYDSTPTGASGGREKVEGLYTVKPLESKNLFVYNSLDNSFYHEDPQAEEDPWTLIGSYKCTSRTAIVQIAYLYCTAEAYPKDLSACWQRVVNVINNANLSGVKAGGVGTKSNPKIWPGLPDGFDNSLVQASIDGAKAEAEAEAAEAEAEANS